MSCVSWLLLRASSYVLNNDSVLLYQLLCSAGNCGDNCGGENRPVSLADQDVERRIIKLLLIL